jgi:hypothetical protein
MVLVILKKNHLAERHLTEKSVGRTPAPFDRKFILPKGHLTEHFLKKKSFDRNYFRQKMSFDRKKVRQRAI